MLIKKVTLIVLTGFITVSLVGTGIAFGEKMETWTSSKPLPVPRVVKDRPLHIGYAAPNMTSESCQRDWHQAQIELEHRGWKVTPILDAVTQDAQRDGMKTFINKNVDAIVIVYWEMEPLRDLILEARRKGIGVYCVDTELRDGVLINSTQPNGVVGAQMFYYGLDRLKARGKMLILSLPYHILRRRCYAARGLVENDWPALELVGFEDMPFPGWEKAAFDITANYVTKYGNDLDWVFAGWDIPGIFAARAIEQAGYTRDDIFVTGIDGGSQAYGEIRKGSPFVATMSQPFEQYVHVCFDVIKQVQVDGIGPGEKGSMIPKSRVIYLKPVLTTPENIPPVGASIHEVFAETYYDPEKKDAWYFWGEPYKIK